VRVDLDIRPMRLRKVVRQEADRRGAIRAGGKFRRKRPPKSPLSTTGLVERYA